MGEQGRCGARDEAADVARVAYARHEESEDEHNDGPFDELVTNTGDAHAVKGHDAESDESEEPAGCAHDGRTNLLDFVVPEVTGERSPKLGEGDEGEHACASDLRFDEGADVVEGVGVEGDVDEASVEESEGEPSEGMEWGGEYVGSEGAHDCGGSEIGAHNVGELKSAQRDLYGEEEEHEAEEGLYGDGGVRRSGRCQETRNFVQQHVGESAVAGGADFGFSVVDGVAVCADLVGVGEPLQALGLDAGALDVFDLLLFLVELPAQARGIHAQLFKNAYV